MVNNVVTKEFIAVIVMLFQPATVITITIDILVMAINFKYAETMILLRTTMKIPFVVAFNLVINLEISKLVDFILLVY